MENLKTVIEKIKAVKSSHKFISKAKKEKIAYYTKYKDRVDSMLLSDIIGHDFNTEIINASFTIEKLEYFKKHKYKNIYRLETHTYAPELNRLVFKNGKEFKVNGITEIDKAIAKLIEKSSLEQLQSI